MKQNADYFILKTIPL